ncbi:MAG: SseB family protein [Metallibacterium scheffleri]|jgi:hypothetical protein|uniref:SseB family protein n=1 Tax=Metallibacterium scheffleri TaxID=993689 RepID=UPI0026EE72B0|nr:SseB family protein [Metallibacterium scheffleri]MCK9366579.1 SseB family protein [Metallibacterium scheffleri]
MASSSKLEALLEVIRGAKTAAAIARAEDAFFVALLDATVYAHRPSGPLPPGRIRFIQFRRPDNGQTVLPFFTDQAQAEVPLSPDRALISMTGRELFELTRGATLMMNPNREQATLYPAEVEALLAGRPLGNFTRETLPLTRLVDGRPPSVPADELIHVLRDCFALEATVRAGYLVEVQRPPGEPEETFLLLIVVAPTQHAERLLHAISLALATSKPSLSLPLTVGLHGVDEELPKICDRGIQFYGT